ncbi:MAG: enoyl-CoA hydratase/isomerase family protein [Deltaproteobacteria bacterium]|nr:MAG: enoyl-CoA hydratase/isomerase family protein [Deltaproteobacteria bacterium]
MSYIEWKIEEDIGIVVINRPDKKNALNKQVREELFQALQNIEKIRPQAIIITGVKDVFVAGADLYVMKDYTEKEAKEASMHGCRIFSYIEDMDIPSIAAINGWALGGGLELALCCDIRVCSEDARMGQPELKLGIIPGYGATFRLPRIVGMGVAKELILTGRIINAQEAKEIGLVNKVVKKERLLEEAKKIAKQISSAKIAVSYAKKAINTAFDISKEDAIEYISSLYGKLYNTYDAKEGINAYLEKRRPRFKGE